MSFIYKLCFCAHVRVPTRFSIKVDQFETFYKGLRSYVFCVAERCFTIIPLMFWKSGLVEMDQGARTGNDGIILMASFRYHHFDK